ncbi:MAG: hypothetical protein GY731_05310 [Gammaproteobacteria bacterium]|nr:hypothetical protein [Gammaproteobacteria bacterium]
MTKSRIYKEDSGIIVYRSKMHATLAPNFQLLPGAKWLEMLLQHVPDKGEHLVRYYGWYGNRSRGERRALEEEEGEQGNNGMVIEGHPEHVDPELSRAAKQAWARMIQKVYEVDPMMCPKCGTEMRIMAMIEDNGVIEKILTPTRPRP